MDKGIRILLVEDHDIVRRGLRLLLEGELGAEVVEAATAADAVRWAADSSIDLVLMDVRLPGQDGLWVLGEIRAVRADLPVIVMSTFRDEDAVHAAIDGGAQGYIIKDATLAQLRDAIDSAMTGDGLYLHPAVAHLVAGRRRSADQDQLSARELMVLQRLVEGAGNEEIAGLLFLSEKTVKSHLTSIFRKLGVSNRTQAVAKAIREDIVAPPEGTG